MIRRHHVVTLSSVAGVLAIIVSSLPVAPLLVWNASDSAPLGLYAVRHRQALVRGDYVLLTLPLCWRDFAAARSYLPHYAPIIKPVAALPGDKVCSIERRITINDETVATAYSVDQKRQPMPRWSGCRILASDEVFLLGAHPASFDGRYFGVMSMSGILGRAQKLF
ncbi:MAG: S26 family signal peptidase [Hyphomicrobiales bacterium]|nr:S26 family signal peptidase [Hyphomicrobiales bacterium]